MRRRKKVESDHGLLPPLYGFLHRWKWADKRPSTGWVCVSRSRRPHSNSDEGTAARALLCCGGWRAALLFFFSAAVSPLQRGSVAATFSTALFFRRFFFCLVEFGQMKLKWMGK